VVRHLTLDQTIGGSNPPSPAGQRRPPMLADLLARFGLRFTTPTRHKTRPWRAPAFNDLTTGLRAACPSLPSVCLSCDVVSGRRKVVGGLLHKTRDWTISHAVDAQKSGPWLIVQPTEHLKYLTDLGLRAQLELGPLLADCERALRAIVPAHRVFVAAPNEWEEGHFHVHVFVEDHDLADRLNPLHRGLRAVDLWAKGSAAYMPDDFLPFAPAFKTGLATFVSARNGPRSVV
jgi:diadenosine tetraphosphate (Ap4A) HIT family hydrolase